MLEHDLKRLKAENVGLKSSLEKAERSILYFFIRYFKNAPRKIDLIFYMACSLNWIPRLVYGPGQQLHYSQDSGTGGGNGTGGLKKSKSAINSVGGNSSSLRSKSPMTSRSTSSMHSGGGEGGSEYGHSHGHSGNKSSHPPWRSGMWLVNCVDQ